MTKGGEGHTSSITPWFSVSKGMDTSSVSTLTPSTGWLETVSSFIFYKNAA